MIPELHDSRTMVARQVARTPDCRADGSLLAELDSPVPVRFFHPATIHAVHELTGLLWSVLWTSNCSADTQLHIVLQDIAQHDLPSAPPFGLVFPEEQLEDAFRVSLLPWRLGGLIRFAAIVVVIFLTRSATCLFWQTATPIPSTAVTATLTGIVISMCALIIVIGKLLMQCRIAQSSAIANTGPGLLTVLYFVRQIWVVLSFTHGPMPPAVVTWITLCTHAYIVPTMIASMFSVQFYIVTDDKVMRMGYKMLYKKLRNLDINNSVILGATFDVACTVADRVLRFAGQYGEDKTFVILDQNLDGYPEGRVYGTDITKELRVSGFGGPIFIRSANDDIILSPNISGQERRVVSAKVAECRSLWPIS